MEFLKCRYHDFVNKAAPIVWLAANLSKQEPSFYGALKTNTEVWLKGDYNDYKNCYWFPHIDNGYNCIIYFNQDSKNGTNLYDPSLRDEEWFSSLMKEVPAGAQPWISKEKTKLLKTLKPKYNRMVLFDGSYFPHSPAIEDEKYFVDDLDNANKKNTRSTLCFFFHPKTNDNKKS